jgi:ribose-phosphate pyrophosphokinase
MPISVNNQPVETFQFAGGEIQVKIKPSLISEKTEIRAFLNSSNDVMALLLTVDAVRRVNSSTKISLTIPYFPYARQDRVCNEGEALSVKVMADLINSLHCESVHIYDPHSDLTPALLHRCKVSKMAHLISNSSLVHLIREGNWVLVSPDAGAEKKTAELAKVLSSEQKKISMICARKVRDTLTGEILSTKVSEDPLLIRGRDLILVDDICDGGRTFIELAKVLKSQGAEKLFLYVTHGIFSKGFDELKQYFHQVYCFYPMQGQMAQTDPFLVTLT